MNTLSQSLFNTAKQLLATGSTIDVSAIVLPEINDNNHCRDEFGFIILNNEYVGPFYVSLGSILKELSQRFPQGKSVNIPIETLLHGFNQNTFCARALALGAYNALSHRYFINHPEYLQKRQYQLHKNIAHIGMVGHFDPMIERYLSKGIKITLLEDNTTRVVPRTGLTHANQISDLAKCDRIICTASTVINDTLEEIIAAAPESEFHLIGPSASGYGKPYFDIGVDVLGGTLFSDAKTLFHSLATSNHFSTAGTKFNIHALTQ